MRVRWDDDDDDDRRPDETRAALTFELVTLFPELFAGFLLGAPSSARPSRPASSPFTARTRATSRPGRHRQVDDTPYGGGPGMIMRVEPIAAALDAIAAARGPSRRILLTPRGRAASTRRRPARWRPSRA